MTAYYKATRPNGTDFRTGYVDYAAALLSGAVIRHPASRKVRNEASTYLSISVSAADCTGFSWPCRLFRVEPVGRVMVKLSASPSKRAVSALRVVEELPAWQAFGPNGEAVVALIERASRVTPEEARLLAAARAATRAATRATWAAAQDAAWAAAQDATWAATRAATWAAWAAAQDATRAAARAATWALVNRGLITPEQFDALYGPWKQVMEP